MRRGGGEKDMGQGRGEWEDGTEGRDCNGKRQTW